MKAVLQLRFICRSIKPTVNSNKKYTENIRKRLTDYGYKEELVHLYVIGGGGCLLQNYSDLGEKAGVTFITDICANAKGYEILAEKKLRR